MSYQWTDAAVARIARQRDAALAEVERLTLLTLTGQPLVDRLHEAFGRRDDELHDLRAEVERLTAERDEARNTAKLLTNPVFWAGYKDRPLPLPWEEAANGGDE